MCYFHNNILLLKQNRAEIKDKPNSALWVSKNLCISMFLKVASFPKVSVFF